MTNLKPKYDFKEVEENRYQTFWLKDKGYFKSGVNKKAPKPFTIVNYHHQMLQENLHLGTLGIIP